MPRGSRTVHLVDYGLRADGQTQRHISPTAKSYMRFGSTTTLFIAVGHVCRQACFARLAIIRLSGTRPRLGRTGRAALCLHQTAVLARRPTALQHGTHKAARDVPQKRTRASSDTCDSSPDPPMQHDARGLASSGAIRTAAGFKAARGRAREETEVDAAVNRRQQYGPQRRTSAVVVDI